MSADGKPYSPEPVGNLDNLPDFQRYVLQELDRIAEIIGGLLQKEMPELHAEPAKLRDYLTVAADGTDWDPGSGQGVYTYYAGAWHKLG